MSVVLAYMLENHGLGRKTTESLIRFRSNLHVIDRRSPNVKGCGPNRKSTALTPVGKRKRANRIRRMRMVIPKRHRFSLGEMNGRLLSDGAYMILLHGNRKFKEVRRVCRVYG